MTLAFGFLFLNSASAAVVENIHVPKEVQEHVNYITKNCDVITHLTERIKEDERAGGVVVDPLRNIDTVIRSCDDGTFKNSRKVWDNYHAWLFNEVNNGKMIPVFTKLKHQAQHFVRTGRYYWSAK